MNVLKYSESLRWKVAKNHKSLIFTMDMNVSEYWAKFIPDLIPQTSELHQG